VSGWRRAEVELLDDWRPPWHAEEFALDFEPEGHVYTIRKPELRLIDGRGPIDNRAWLLFDERAWLLSDGCSRWVVEPTATPKRMEVISVTTLIGLFSGGRSWFSDAKARAGTDRHAICELDDRGAEIDITLRGQASVEMTHERTMEKIVAPLNDNTVAALSAWRSFLRTFDVRGQVAIEQPIVSAIGVRDEAEFFAGTIDRVLRMPTADGSGERVVLVDIKGTARMEHYPIQLAAYALAWNTHAPPEYRVSEAWCVHLSSRGGGSFEVVPYGEETLRDATEAWGKMVDLYASRSLWGLRNLEVDHGRA